MKPPPLLHPKPALDRFQISALALALLLAALHFFPEVTQAIPRCALRTFTGIPCPLCGGTRSMMAWSRFDVAGAFRFNPFAGLLPLLIVLWPIVARFQPRVISPRLLLWLSAALGVNWAYLCLTLPP